MEPRPARRPLQHAELVAENEDLEVLGSVLALLASADEEADEGAGDEVEERPHKPIVPGWSERESGFPTLTPSPGRRDLRSGRVVARRAPDPTGELGFPLGRRRAPRRVGRVAQPERSRQRVTGTGGDAGGLRDRPDDVRRAGRCVAEVAALGPGRSVRVARSGSRQPKIPRAWNTASRAAEIARSRSDAATTCSGSTPCGCWPASGRAGSR